MAAGFIAVIGLMPIAGLAQTRITAPKNKYNVQDDIKLGNQASAEVERQFPIINDADAAEYLERVGRRLADAIPPEFDQPSFQYRFKWVNASDLNAFALPGGPMYVNRGMLEAARNEGELAGVMAHEISHVALRHATAQATEQSKVKNQLGMLGMILGGAILGGQAGAQLGMLGAQAWMTKYSRSYETQSDTLGARIMADAGYDPRDLANVFQTIASRSRGGAPEFLSSHPDPGNRFEKINREATYLRVSPNPIKITRDFERIQSRFRAMPPTRTMAELQREGGSGQVQNPTSGGRYNSRVAAPSTRYSQYNNGAMSMSVPQNWRQFETQTSVQFAPEGAYGDQGITHGVMVGVTTAQGGNLRQDTEAYINELLQGNSYLRQQTRLTSRYLAGRQGYTTQLSGRSPITGETEIVNVYTAAIGNGQLFYTVTVVPSNESYRYNNAFSSIVNSVRLAR